MPARQGGLAPIRKLLGPNVTELSGGAHVDCSDEQADPRKPLVSVLGCDFGYSTARAFPNNSCSLMAKLALCKQRFYASGCRCATSFCSLAFHPPLGRVRLNQRGARFKVKYLSVKPGTSLSLYLHNQRPEKWTVVNGTARLTRREEKFLLHEN
jgi:Mannose-6-phosphate isomerase